MSRPHAQFETANACSKHEREKRRAISRRLPHTCCSAEISRRSLFAAIALSATSNPCLADICFGRFARCGCSSGRNLTPICRLICSHDVSLSSYSTWGSSTQIHNIVRVAYVSVLARGDNTARLAEMICLRIKFGTKLWDVGPIAAMQHHHRSSRSAP